MMTLIDSFGRKLDYLRVSVTDKCNLRCAYCMPPEGIKLLPHDEVLRNEEFIHLLGLFVQLGVVKLRFTGGEPLVRKGFIDIVRRTKELYPRVEMGLTTNGILLDEVMEDLHRIGMRKLNVSLDTLSRDRYRAISGQDSFDRVLRNIEAALRHACFEVKINTVLFDASSLAELDGLLEYFKDKKATLRFIERMPFGARQDGSFIPSENLVQMLHARGALRRDTRSDTNVAVMYTLIYKNRHPMRIGVIPSMTHKFCNRCNRLRLTCDGKLKTCLLSPMEFDLKGPYRMDMGDETLRSLILEAARQKPREHQLSCEDPGDGCTALCSSGAMSRIGG